MIVPEDANRDRWQRQKNPERDDDIRRATMRERGHQSENLFVAASLVVRIQRLAERGEARRVERFPTEDNPPATVDDERRRHATLRERIREVKLGIHELRILQPAALRERRDLVARRAYGH